MAKRRSDSLDHRKIGENITKLMLSIGIDATQLSRATGLPTSTISRLRSNSTEFSPNLSSLMPLAEYFSITISQLIGEEPIDSISGEKTGYVRCRKTSIPVLDADSIHDHLINNDHSSFSIIDVDIPVSESAFAYILRGNSMEPQFPDNSLLIIDPEEPYENLDHLLVIPIGKQTPILRNVLIDGDEQYLRALNPAFDEFNKFDKSAYKVLGVMMQCRNNFKLKNQFRPSVLLKVKEI